MADTIQPSVEGPTASSTEDERMLNLLADEPFEPSTPRDAAPPSTQQSIPSTQDPASPTDPSQSFKTELNDDRELDVVPSSLTPPPSSQQVARAPGAASSSYFGIQHTHVSNGAGSAALFSPPVTGPNTTVRRDASSADYVPPTPAQVVAAAADELRAMLQACIAEHAKLKMETAHHKLQFNLLSLQADEEAKRAAVEHEMTRREVEILRKAENTRKAHSSLAAASESAELKYFQLKTWYEEVLAENEAYQKRLKSAKKVIQQKEDDIVALKDERDLLLTRIRENRQHFQMLRSPGGIFHAALTPKTSNLGTPQAGARGTPRQHNRRSTVHEHRVDAEPGTERFAALLRALDHENNSAPSTPVPNARPAARMPPKHTRAVQSLSSLPTTPTSRHRNEHSGLLPSAKVIPHTEPPRRYSGGGLAVATPTKGRHSRESTISADDNAELARQALEAAAQQSFLSQRPRRNDEEEEIFESQASQAASEMLRRDPRESFEVASSVGSRDGTPAPAEKTAKLQARLYGGLHKSTSAPGVDKRKFSGCGEGREEASGARQPVESPNKKARMALPDGRKVGLGIQYSRES